IGRREDVADQVLRLVDAAQDRVLTGEDLHCHERIEPLPLEDAGRAGEIDVGRIARENLARRARSNQPHQPSCWSLVKVSSFSSGAPGGGSAGGVGNSAGGSAGGRSGGRSGSSPAPVDWSGSVAYGPGASAAAA